MFKWLRPRIEIRGEILFPQEPPTWETKIVYFPMAPPVEEEPPKVEYGPLRLVKDDDA